MGKSKKDMRKRRVGYVLGSLDRAMEHCMIVKAEFDDLLKLDPLVEGYTEALKKLFDTSQHAKLAYLLHGSLMMMLRAQFLVEQFCVAAYGKVPDKVERWTNTGQQYREQKEQEAARSTEPTG